MVATFASTCSRRPSLPKAATEGPTLTRAAKGHAVFCGPHGAAHRRFSAVPGLASSQGRFDGLAERVRGVTRFAGHRFEGTQRAACRSDQERGGPVDVMP
jgi:hypothetical protein